MYSITGNSAAMVAPTKTWKTHIFAGPCPKDSKTTHVMPLTIQGSYIEDAPQVSGEYTGPVGACPNGCYIDYPIQGSNF